MDRFFAEHLAGEGSRVALSPEETRHVRVRRVARGSEVRLFDGAGREAVARLAEFDGRSAVFEVVEVRAAPPDASPLVTVAAAIPKGPRMAELVRACTEVGAWKIWPTTTDRSVARPAEGSTNERWTRIAREAAKQSRRLHVPEVLPVAGLDEVLDSGRGHDLRIVGDAASGSVPLREACEGRRGAGTALVLVGPEGGLSQAETERAAAAGFVRVRLPLPVMRVETAAPVLVAAVILASS